MCFFFDGDALFSVTFAPRMTAFSRQISKLAGILIEDQCNKLKCAPDYHKCKYADLDQNVRFYKGKTIMHLVAEENMSILASQLITKFPGLLLLGQDSDDKLPVQLALAKFNDEVAAVMIKRMNNERYVSSLELITYDNVDYRRGRTTS